MSRRPCPLARIGAGSRFSSRWLLAWAAAACLAQPEHPRAQGLPAATNPAVQTGLPTAPDAAAKPWTPPATLPAWASAIQFSGEVDAGVTGNPQDPSDGVNFGRLFTDKANRPILNQLLLTLERDLDPKATGYDWGFNLQGLYGSDARIVHLLGLFDHAIHDRNQVTLESANVTLHAPWLFGGGVDLKAGIFPSPLGFEVLDPKANPFYSHSYIFDSLPYEHLGLLAVAHATSVLDLYVGIDTGNDTTLGQGDDNRRPAGIAGFGLTGLGGLTVIALTHVGPEDAKRTAPFADSALRYYNDLVVTYKSSPKLAFTTEIDYVREDGFRAEGYGAAQYASYVLNDALTLNGRAEVWRDNANFFISTPVNNLDYVNGERGYMPANFYTAARPTTYSELTAGVTYKLVGLPKPVGNVLLRPELRYDRTLNGSKPFNDGRDKGMVTIAADVVAGF